MASLHIMIYAYNNKALKYSHNIEKNAAICPARPTLGYNKEVIAMSPLQARRRVISQIANDRLFSSIQLVDPGFCGF